MGGAVKSKRRRAPKSKYGLKGGPGLNVVRGAYNNIFLFVDSTFWDL